MRSDIIDHRLSASGRPSLAQWLSPALIGGYLLRLWQTHQERCRLAELEPRLLRDIGIDPVAATQEVERPFWQLSAHHEAAFRRQLGH
jgi:uncharacterized protein YjiS (DUF1127 family)